MLTPGALSGTTQVIDSFSCPAATGCRLPQPRFMAEYRGGAQHLQAVDGHSAIVFVDHAQRRRRVSLVVCRTERAPALRIGDGVGGENIVAAHVLVIIADVVAKALTDAVEHPRIHHQPAHITREVVGRAAEQTMRPRGPPSNCLVDAWFARPLARQLPE